MTEAIENSLKEVKPLERFTELFKSKSDEETLNNLFRFLGDLAPMPAYLSQIGSLVDSVNMLREQLRREGLVFEFPEITKPVSIEIAKQVTLPALRGS